ncbi:hypothetical protein M2451_003999 [Dysgonomonas sp. PFB1-18]|uniref:hypothetical protein n=1 Tax=unclassified Dysgonomonas TaxID=2630389 RepID=UPI00247384E7|nr:MULTISPECIES: hypothetical protein [unclassified Dysgonomonas]MDH6311132.1 hypothetical protein [Dysgonomonas sp. PF1-14]MDH6341014.1 hypothetical protein [Dysgonomonas sp. PF1-16]MDH6382654.1 hypothetical protein [Dysgonomonas sp. PFB1-18]MDH6399997.1 hypothetical protein [Dysgonomonas sp. PF1-23]
MQFAVPPDMKYIYVNHNTNFTLKIRAAFDVGKDGGIVIFRDEKLIYKGVMPTIGNQIDLLGIRKILAELDSNNSHFAVEDVHAIFGASAKSTFNFGWSLGVLEGMLVGMGIPYTKVAPKEWQKLMWQGVQPVYKSGKSIDTKATSLLAANRLFPNEDFRKSERAEKPHDGIVDALLMAEYCRRKF